MKRLTSSPTRLMTKFEGSMVSSVQLIRSKRRTLSLEIREDLEVKVRAPRWTAESEIRQFIESRSAWIEKTRLEIQRRLSLLHGGREGGLYWNGKLYPLFPAPDLRERFCFSEDQFLIHPLWHEDVERTAEAWFRKQASMILESRLKELAESMSLSYTRFRLGGARTRWGSCSHGGTITLHWRLVWVPAWVRDYVIAHELCHRRHFDHSRLFWKTLAKFSPQYREACDWLREYSGMLTLKLSRSLASATPDL